MNHPSISPLDEPSTDDLLNMHVRMPNGDKLPLTVAKDCTVADLRVLVYATTNIPEHRQKLVYAGKVVQSNIDDAMDGSTYCSQFNFRSGGTIYLVALPDRPVSPLMPSAHISPTAAAHSRGIPTGINTSHTNGQDGLASMLGASPIMDAMLSNSDLLHSMVMMDPRMRELARSNPDMARMLRDPDFLRQMVHTSRNPAALREMQRTQDRALANLETIPGGFMALQRLYSQTSGALDAAMAGPRMSSQEEDHRSQQLARSLGVHDVNPGSLNTQALPNPWAPAASSPPITPTGMSLPLSFASSFLSPSSTSRTTGDYANLIIRQPSQSSTPEPFNLMSPPTTFSNRTNSSSSSSSAVPVVSSPLLVVTNSTSEDLYDTQLHHMVDMGFDRVLSARALTQAKGDLDVAVELVVASVAEGDNGVSETQGAGAE